MTTSFGLIRTPDMLLLVLRGLEAGVGGGWLDLPEGRPLLVLPGHLFLLLVLHLLLQI